MNSKPTIYFVFPYHGVGGVSVLFYRVAKFLAEHQLAEPVLVDYADGTMMQLVKTEETKLDTLIYSDECKIKIPADSFAVFQSMTPWSIFPNVQLDPEARLLFWNCHPYNLVLFIPFFRSITYRCKKLNRIVYSAFLRSWSRALTGFINIIERDNALVFMDQENVRNTELYNNIEFRSCRFLPIPVDIEAASKIRSAYTSTSTLKFTWIGRVVDFKYYPLKRIMIDLDAYAAKSGQNITLDIVGSGPCLEKTQAVSNQLGSLKTHFLGDLSLPSVRDLIANDTDIVVAMGTSALEGGALGVPTILLDLSYKDIHPNYHYKWLYQTENFNLAEEVSPAHLDDDAESLGKLLAEYIADSKTISDSCYRYVVAHHSLEAVSKLLLKYVSETELTAKQIEKFRKRNSIGGTVYKVLRNVRLKSKDARAKS